MYKISMVACKTIVVICIIIAHSNCDNLVFKQFLASTPKTFGLLTVTRARSGDFTFFKEHLKRYAEMDCPIITEISVVWNNEKSVSDVIQSNSNWKRPVYYYTPPHNSMDFRYTLPKESTAEVFFNIDDDIVTTCQELTKSFNLWQKSAIGNIGPLIGYAPRGFDFEIQKQKFVYSNPKQGQYFSLQLIGVTWISKIYLELYNTNKIEEITKIREIVRAKNNCDDIAMNYIVSFLFPQLLPIATAGDLRMLDSKSSQTSTSTHYSYRSGCVKQFTDIIGYNPLRIVHKMDANASTFQWPIFKETIFLKMVHFRKLLDSDNLNEAFRKASYYKQLIKKSQRKTQRKKVVFSQSTPTPPQTSTLIPSTPTSTPSTPSPLKTSQTLQYLASIVTIGLLLALIKCSRQPRQSLSNFHSRSTSQFKIEQIPEQQYDEEQSDKNKDLP